jgi:ATP-dependent Clp protease ATP-binding subunit ClpA
MFERFTTEARTVVTEAQAESRELRHDHTGVEHLLLGVLREHDSRAAQRLRVCGVRIDRFRGRLLEVMPAGRGELQAERQLPFSPRAKRVLEMSLREALSRGTNAVASEHLLLAITREINSVTMRILREEWELSPEMIRENLPTPKPVRVSPDRGDPVPEVGRVERSMGIWVNPSSPVRRLLMAAGALALSDERTEIEIADVLLALIRDTSTAALFTELGIELSAARDALQRQNKPDDPPQASAGG